MSNPNIGREASKGGKARWKGVSKKERSAHLRRCGIISAAVKKERKLVDSVKAIK
jgi:hypothetical protein